jgi:hypothetical protein
MVGWILLGVLIVASGPIAFLVHPFSDALGITQGALLSILGTMFVVAICVQLSISISGIHERLRRTSEEVSHLKNSVDSLSKK